MTLPVTHVLLTMHVEWCALGQVKRAKLCDTMLDVQAMPCAAVRQVLRLLARGTTPLTVSASENMMMCFT